LSGALAGRIALVTGASRGIGRAVAQRFAREGATVVALARTLGALEELDDGLRAEGMPPLVLVPGDITDETLIDTMARALAERFGRLDVLVGNAGILGTLSPLGHIKPTTWDSVIATNLTANWRLIRYLEPLLKRGHDPRAIFMTARVGHQPHAYWGAYAVAKAGLESLARVWADEVSTTPLRVNLYDPGPTRTGLRANAYPGDDPKTLPTPESHTDALVELASAGCGRHGEIVRGSDISEI